MRPQAKGRLAVNKIALVLRHEIYTLLSRPSYWIVLLALPAAGLLFSAGMALISRQQQVPAPLEAIEEQLSVPREEYLYQGYVDEPGLVKDFPPDFPHEVWEPFSDLDSGLRDLDAGYLDRLYHIPADYLERGEVVVYSPGVHPLTAADDFAPLEMLIQYNLIGGADLADAVQNPLREVTYESIAPPEETQRELGVAGSLFLPYGMMLLLFVTIFGSSSLMLNSVAGEKENRVMEVLLNSVSTREMLVGKIIGLGLVGLLQVSVWSGSSYLLLRLSGQAFSMPPGLALEPAVLIWVGVFFILGYMLYASLMAGVGALVPNLREASQMTMLVTLPMVIPFFLISPLIDNPSGGLAVFFSLLPFTAPQVMVLRLAASHPPLWQPLLSAGLMLAAILVSVRLTARLFRAQTIMTGQSGSVVKMVRAIFNSRE